MIESIFSISDGQFWSTFFNLNISSLWNIQWTKRSFFNNVLGESPIWHTNACGNFPKIVGILEKKAEISPSMVQSADLLKRGMKFSKICSMIWMLSWCHFQSSTSIIDSFHWQWHDRHDDLVNYSLANSCRIDQDQACLARMICLFSKKARW